MNSSSSKILLIESDPALAERMSAALKARSYSVFLEHEGADGLKAVSDVLPQLIIIDLAVKGMDAYDVLSGIQAEPLLKKIPIFLLSIEGAPINMRKVPENADIDFVVSVGEDIPDLVSRVDTHFGRDKTADAPVAKPPGKKILWVEDDKLLGSILEKKFISSGFDLTRATNGEEALAHFKDGVPDIIIVDLMLPGMDGFEILQKFKLDPKFQKVPSMVLSNLSKPSDLEKARLLGVTKFMVKASSSLDQIVTEVRSLVK